MDYVPSVVFTEHFYDANYNDAEVELGNPGTVLEIATKTKLSSLELGHCVAMFKRKDEGYSVSAIFVKIGDNILRRVSTDPGGPVFPESISMPGDTLLAAVNSIGIIKMQGNLVNFPPVLGIPFKPFFREQALAYRQHRFSEFISESSPNEHQDNYGGVEFEAAKEGHSSQ